MLMVVVVVVVIVRRDRVLRYLRLLVGSLVRLMLSQSGSKLCLPVASECAASSSARSGRGPPRGLRLSTTVRVLVVGGSNLQPSVAS